MLTPVCRIRKGGKNHEYTKKNDEMTDRSPFDLCGSPFTDADGTGAGCTQDDKTCSEVGYHVKGREDTAFSCSDEYDQRKVFQAIGGVSQKGKELCGADSEENRYRHDHHRR